jgi:hypothetical protein
MSIGIAGSLGWNMLYPNLNKTFANDLSRIRFVALFITFIGFKFWLALVEDQNGMENIGS